MVIRYSESLTKQAVEVRSPGKDGESGTHDDITSSKELPRRKRDIAVDLYRKAREALRERSTRDETSGTE